MMEQYGENKFGKVSQMKLSASVKDGKTILDDVYFTAPYKMMKPFQKENGGIQVMPLCASAGIMKGDVQRFEYAVGTGADLEVLSQSFEKIHVSAGKIGAQITLSPVDLAKVAKAVFAEIIVWFFRQSIFFYFNKVFFHNYFWQISILAY